VTPRTTCFPSVISMPNLPLISVVIPNHNGSGYLRNCLRSLLAQTYAKMEIVIVTTLPRINPSKPPWIWRPGRFFCSRSVIWDSPGVPMPGSGSPAEIGWLFSTMIPR